MREPVYQDAAMCGIIPRESTAVRKPVYQDAMSHTKKQNEDSRQKENKKKMLTAKKINQDDKAGHRVFMGSD